MYYLIKTKNSIPFILGQFENYDDAEEALEEALEETDECVIVGDVEEFLETFNDLKEILNSIVDELAKSSLDNMLMRIKLRQLGAN